MADHGGYLVVHQWWIFEVICAGVGSRDAYLSTKLLKRNNLCATYQTFLFVEMSETQLDHSKNKANQTISKFSC